jgi:PQQ-dependent catabolism-associated CXXCW motif protein
MNDDQLSMIDERLPQAANCKPRTGHRSRVTRLILVAGIGIVSSSTSALAEERSYGGEDRDWNIPPTAQFRTDDYHGPTPRTIPGGRVVRTIELHSMLIGRSPPYVIDVLGGRGHRTIRGAFWLPGAGAGDLGADESRRFVEAVAKFAAGDKSRPLVFFCADRECWLSYNAALRAIAAGYTNIMWFRGGIAAWLHAGLPMSPAAPFAW